MTKALNVFSGVLECAGNIAESCYSCTDNNGCGICEDAAGILKCLPKNQTQNIGTYCVGVWDSSSNIFILMPLNILEFDHIILIISIREEAFNFEYISAGASIETVCKTKESWLAIVGLVVYIMGFAPGMGPLPWTINRYCRHDDYCSFSKLMKYLEDAKR